MGYAFISYSSTTKDKAYAMRQVLEKNNIGTWIAPENIPAGSEYADVLYEALVGCSCVVVLLSKAAQESIWVKNELNTAVDNKKPIIPVKLEEMELNNVMKMYFGNRHIVIIDKVDEFSDDAQGVVSGVAEYTGVNKNREKTESQAGIETEANDPDLAASYHSAGIFYANQGQPQKAEEYYLKAIEIYEALASANPERFNLDLAMSYNNAGNFYSGQGQPQKAEEYYLKTIAICEALASKNPKRFNLDLAASYNNAGNFYDYQGQPQEAEEYYLKAIAIREALASANPTRFNPDLAASYNNAGVFYEHQGQPQRAEVYHLKAIAIREALAEEARKDTESKLTAKAVREPETVKKTDVMKETAVEEKSGFANAVNFLFEIQTKETRERLAPLRAIGKLRTTQRISVVSIVLGAVAILAWLLGRFGIRVLSPATCNLISGVASLAGLIFVVVLSARFLNHCKDDCKKFSIGDVGRFIKSRWLVLFLICNAYTFWFAYGWMYGWAPLAVRLLSYLVIAICGFWTIFNLSRIYKLHISRTKDK